MKRLTRDEAGTGGSPPADSSIFTGPVRQNPIHSMTDPHPVRALVVTFEDGARTYWHRHSGGQVLHVIAGAGRTCSRGGEPVELGPGDTVVTEPGEEHWHGAADGATMTHLAISIGDSTWAEAPD
jgi:quercetin dioxygenase-like cupin family protein